MQRRNIHYWKCDRPDAFHGIARSDAEERIRPVLQSLLASQFSCPTLTLAPAGGQGIHLTWTCRIHDTSLFVRVAHGLDSNAQLTVESALLAQLSQLNIPVPRVIAHDDSRKNVPFGWQVLELIPHPDLNHWHKQGLLHPHEIPFQIGRNIALWQSFQPREFGILELTPQGVLVGGHSSYRSYFELNLHRHLDFLHNHGFIATALRHRIIQTIETASPFLNLQQGVLVHKDLALWNILGSPKTIAAFIDFEDAISGDPTEDLALLACFHSSTFVKTAIQGFQTIKPLPSDFLRRFWLHLLRNMLVKSVIRLGAGYFNRTDSFFLINQGSSGSNLRTFTLSRISSALDGFENNLEINVSSLP